MRPFRAFGVWLLLLVVWVWPSRSLAQTAAPVLTHPVTDLAQVLDSDVEIELNDLLVVHYTDHAQIAILTVSSTLGEPIEDYSLRVATQWAGGRAGADDGILVVIAVADRRMRIELGYGAETLITDAEARKILDDARPRLRTGDYAGAVREICGKLMKKTGGVVPQGYVPPRPPPEPAVPEPWGFIGLFLLASVIGVLGWSRHTQSAAIEEHEDTDENTDEEDDLDWAPFREPSLFELLRVRAFVMTVSVAVVVSALIGQLMGWGPEFALCGLVGAIAGWRFLWHSISSLGHVVILLGIVLACFALMQDTALYVSAFGALILGLLHANWDSSGGGGGSWGGFSRDDSFWNPPSPSRDSGSFWSSSSSDSGSLWSSSSSSSTWDSGSSSSSSDYSGGGGSFGGGGASSSW